MSPGTTLACQRNPRLENKQWLPGVGHGFLATGLYGLVGMDHIWRHLVGHVAGGPLGLQPLGWCTKAGRWGSAEPKATTHNTCSQKSVAGTAHRKKKTHACNLVDGSYNKAHVLQKCPISIQEKFKAWQACWSNFNTIKIQSMASMLDPWKWFCDCAPWKT